MNRFLNSLALVAALALAACGGGGGGGSDAPTSGSGPTAPSDGGSPLPGTPLANDPLAIVSSATPVSGRIPNGAARNVRATYHGPATIGELMEVYVNFADLTYTWTVVQSAYDIEQQSQSGTLTANANGAGYTMSGGGTLLIMNTGSLFVTGFALDIGGTPVSQALFAQPRTSEVNTIDDIKGTYTFGQFDHEPGERFPFGAGTAAVKWGTTRITSDGRMDLCMGSADLTSCTRVVRRTVTFSDGRCPTNLVAVTEGADFIGCMVVSSNGTNRETVLYLDMQNSPAQLPGAAIFVGQPVQQFTLSDGSYASVAVANLAPDTSGCSQRPFIVEGTSLTATCGTEGATQQAVFSINRAAPMPTNVNGLIDDENKLDTMLLQIADGMWLTISPTLGWSGDIATKRGNMRVLVRQ